MEWLKKLLDNKLLTTLSISSILSLITFGSSLIGYLSDGILSDDEIHHLMSGASGLQLALLGVVMIFVKKK